MPVFRLTTSLIFPDPSLAEPSGLLAVGGDLSVARLRLAYARGIFPWFDDDQPLLWWSPDPRAVLFTDELRVQRSLAKRVRRGDYRITLDAAFSEVVRACAGAPRPGQDGTWITEDMVAAYEALHAAGDAHSCEAWDGDRLVGGLYGVATGRVFCGESMFARASDASKVAFVHLASQLRRWGFPLIDCQQHTAHLARFGAREVSRQAFLSTLRAAGTQDVVPAPWRFDEGFAPDV